MSAWEPAGDCDVTCGGGLQDWIRHVEIEAAHSGDACPSDLTKQEPCNNWDCPVDCEVRRASPRVEA